jgi:hypothetical protein
VPRTFIEREAATDVAGVIGRNAFERTKLGGPRAAFELLTP